MYPQFFGLQKLPFRLRPDADFLYPSADYLRARTKLQVGLKGRHRVFLLLGHGGMGKTMLLEDLLKSADPECTCCRINQPQISASELLEALLRQLGASLAEPEGSRTRSYDELVSGLEAIATRGASLLLVVDDAHLLPPSTAKAFIEILNRAPNIKMVLCGRSGLGLEEMALRFLAGEEPWVVRLPPLAQQDTRAYIEHRLTAAGGRSRELIAADCYPLIFQQTGGAPRLINVLCDAALHTACLRASGQVGSAEVLTAIQDSRWPEAVARDRAGAGVRDVNRAELSEVPADDKPLQAQLVLSVGEETLWSRPLPPGRVRIGRAVDNEFRLETRFVSRHHCQVITAGSVSTIEDLESVNGISVNGRLVKQHVLKHADKVQLGDHTLTYIRS